MSLNTCCLTRSLFLIFCLIGSSSLFAQEEPKKEKIKLYNEEISPQEQIEEAVVKAGLDGKHVLLQLGGNWCSWCIKFHQFIQDDPELKDYVEQNYVSVKINYSSKNRNESTMDMLGFPQRFGFPVFVILDGKGKQIHTQNSVYLEEDKSYNKKTVMGFLKDWSPNALKPEHYNNKN